ncbi:hypothetical protein VTO42DRAFT_2163 [Malbranchea cinnamomea]
MASYYDEDQASEAAIAASLEDAQAAHPASSQTHSKFVDLTEDSDDSDTPVIVESCQGAIQDPGLQKAISLSLQQQTSAMNSSQSGKAAEIADKNTTPDTPRQVYGILGLDRKKMEEERLARLAKKRKAEGLCPPSPKQSKSNTTPAGDVSSSQQGKLKPPSVPQESGIQYPHGAVKRTWAYGCNRNNDIKIEEVLQKSDLSLAVLSSFLWDMDWLFSKMDISKTRFLLVMGAKEEAQRRELLNDTARISNLRLCFPPMEAQVNCMHSKLMLLFHPTYLRVVVPSANLVPYDWGEQGGFMENIVFLIDLPRKLQDDPEPPPTFFLNELQYFLQKSGLHENIIAKLSDFDFSKTEDLAFVHTIGGSHTGDAWQRTGHCGLGRAVAQLGLRTSQSLKVDYVTSSVGNLSEQFMRSMYLAAQGDNGLTELTLRTSKTFPSDRWGLTVQRTDGNDWEDKFNVYFPSLKTVLASKAGKSGAGTICFQSKWYNGTNFPRHIMRDNISTRDRLLMHSKILFACLEEGIPHPKMKDYICRGWAYVGSANLSESAWGRLVLDRANKQPKLNCRNWESGVLVPVYAAAGQSDVDTQTGEEEQGKQLVDDGLTAIFNGRIPVPMHVPGPSYAIRQTRPWYFMED